MIEYKIISIKTPEVGPQSVSRSVWNDIQALKDMGYMRYEEPKIEFPETVEPEPVYIPIPAPLPATVPEPDPDPVTTENNPQQDDADPFAFDAGNVPAKRKTKKTITDGA